MKTKLRGNCNTFPKIMGYVEGSLTTSFLAVNEIYHIRKTLGVLLQKIATSTFSAVGCFLHVSSFRQKST